MFDVEIQGRVGSRLTFSLIDVQVHCTLQRRHWARALWSSDCVALLSKYISEIQLHDSLVTTTNTTSATMLPTPAMAQQLLAAFTDTSVMHVLGKGIEQLKQDHVLETVPPKTPATTTLWEKELVKSTEVGGQ